MDRPQQPGRSFQGNNQEGVNKLIQDGYIKARPKKGISSYRSKRQHNRRKKEDEKVEEVSRELKGQETLKKQPG